MTRISGTSVLNGSSIFTAQPRYHVPPAADVVRRLRFSNRDEDACVPFSELARRLHSELHIDLICVAGTLYQARERNSRKIISDAQLFAVIGEMADVAWTTRSSSKKEFFEFLRYNARQFEWMEDAPHEPPISGVYYTFPALPTPSGRLMGQLLDQYSPASPSDRTLIHSLFATPFWGGHGGTRPAFMITSAEDNGSVTQTAMGRGTGKSTLAAHVAELAGGAIEAASDKEIDSVVTRLLSAAGARQRVVRIDNVKTSSLSHAGLERLITSPMISGKKLYEGNGERPNNLTYILTMNGVAASADMASRCVTIRLSRPIYDGTWEERTRSFIRQNRWAIIAEIIEHLRRPSALHQTVTRFAAWEQQVLGKLEGAESARDAFALRSDEINADDDVRVMAATAIENYFSRNAVIRPMELAQLLNQATGEEITPKKILGFLSRYGISIVTRHRDQRGIVYRANARSQPQPLRE